MASLLYISIITTLAAFDLIARLLIAIPVVSGTVQALRKNINSASVAQRIYICSFIAADVAEILTYKLEYCAYKIIDCWPFGQIGCQLSMATFRWIFSSAASYFVCAIVLSKARFTANSLGSQVGRDYVREAKIVTVVIWTAGLIIFPPLVNVQWYTGKSTYSTTDLLIHIMPNDDSFIDNVSVSEDLNSTAMPYAAGTTYYQCGKCKGEYNQNQWVDLSIHVLAEFIPVLTVCIGTLILCWHLYKTTMHPCRQWPSTPTASIRTNTSHVTATLPGLAHDRADDDGDGRLNLGAVYQLQKNKNHKPPHLSLTAQDSSDLMSLRRHSAPNNTNSSSNSQVSHTIWISFFTALVFLVCYTPATIRELINSMAPADREEPDWVKRLVLCASFAHPLLSSLLYFYMLRSFGSFSQHITTRPRDEEQRRRLNQFVPLLHVAGMESRQQNGKSKSIHRRSSAPQTPNGDRVWRHASPSRTLNGHLLTVNPSLATAVSSPSLTTAAQQV